MKLFWTTLSAAILFTFHVAAQSTPVDKVHFFEEEKILPVTLEARWGKLGNQRDIPDRVFPARIITVIDDSIQVNEPVNLQVRGHFRRDYCSMPPIKLEFIKSNVSVMHDLKTVKLVNACRPANLYEQYLLKEYLLYKIYNLLTDKSFRVRLLQIDYKDSSEKKDGARGYAFLTEDIKDLAKRNGCKENHKMKVNMVSTDRKQTTLMTIFEYMIGNTDWSVPADHNIKLIQVKDDSVSKPFCIPYDFDYSGIINAEYAIPDPLLGTQSVTQRVYRGYPRTIEELNAVLQIFKEKKDKIYEVITSFELLNSVNKKSMLDYLDSFYESIKTDKNIKKLFIDNARYD